MRLGGVGGHQPVRPPFAHALPLFAVFALACTRQVLLPGPEVTASDGGDSNDGSASDRWHPADQPDTLFSGTDSPSSGTCPVQAVWDTPEVLIALDRSTTMQQAFGRSTKVSAAVSAIRAAIKAHQGALKIGLEQFGWATAACPSGTCCADEVSVAPSSVSSSIIDRVLDCRPDDAGCPASGDDSAISQALAQCYDHFHDENYQGARYVLLVTDREPTCSRSGETPCEEAYGQVKLLYRLTPTVHTVVLWLSGDARTSGCLSQIPYGGYKSLDPAGRFLVATDEQQLQDKLNEFLDARLCQLFVQGAVVNHDKTTVRFNGENLPQDSWDVIDGLSGNQIAVSGAFCDQLRNGKVQSVEVSTSCWCPGPGSCP